MVNTAVFYQGGFRSPHKLNTYPGGSVKMQANRSWLLGHSMGGAIVMLVADTDPDSILGIINVEGNFTLEDTFWSRKIISDPPDIWDKKYDRMLGDIPECLSRWGISNTTQRVQWLRHVMANQPPSTVYAMACALVKETADPEYLQVVSRVVQRIPTHLIAGERSAAAWGVPEYVRKQAASNHLQPDTGHLMMLEQPAEFCRIVDDILLSSRG